MFSLILVLALAREASTAAAPGPDSFPISADSPEAATVVGPDGGTVSSPDGRISVIVPPGSLSEKARVLVASATGTVYIDGIYEKNTYTSEVVKY